MLLTQADVNTSYNTVVRCTNNSLVPFQLVTKNINVNKLEGFYYVFLVKTEETFVMALSGICGDWEGNLAGVSEPQVTYFEQRDPLPVV